MSATRKFALSRMLELPFAVAAVLTVGYYLFITSDALKGSLLYRYTTEHLVEYVIVGFFIWGLTDVFFRAFTFPREFLALRHDWLPRRVGREPASQAAALLAHLKKKPQWLQDSRIGRRLIEALAHVQEKGTADQFNEYLRYLADQDYEKIQNNYGLTRFICWVTPMFGFLGTVVHFGTALGGESGVDISDKLPKVVAEMGTAFNTTTVALTAATSMMFALFLCERTERRIVDETDRRTDRELMNRFEVADANMVPFLSAIEANSRTTLEALDQMIARQLEIWTRSLDALQQQGEKQQQWQVQVWVEALEKLEQQFEINDAKREVRMSQLLDGMKTHGTKQLEQVAATAEQIAALQAQFSRLVESLGGIAQGKQDLVQLQAALAENLRLLRETQQLDEALHGLTAAIHLITARNHGSGLRAA